jgi:phosphopantothenoylcysteine decarboxylase/phosphopantothenate--cysteine ligase
VQGKRILLGITGSIAAFKSAALIRLLVKSGAEVKVVLTPAAHEFVTPLTLAMLSRNPVLSQFNAGAEGEWNNHVDLGLWADVFLVAPASANTLAKMATGTCDNLLMAVYLSARCPVAVAPAMDVDMWHHPTTRRNLRQLEQDGVQVIQPQTGELASGLVGMGRMAEPEQIFTFLENKVAPGPMLAGKNVLVTAGPTQEAIDPVRYITNYSTGKMGYAVAEAFARAGARVHLVSGPTRLQLHHPHVVVEPVQTAAEMWQACQQRFDQADIAVFAAAVADYAPAVFADQKLKKSAPRLTLELAKTVDIAAELGKRKRSHQITVGFALETENEETHAIEKLERKNFDLIVLNSLRDPGAGFGTDTNRIRIINRNRQVQVFDLKSKQDVARDIVNAVLAIPHA